MQNKIMKKFQKNIRKMEDAMYSKGFSLIETLVTLSITLILLSIGCIPVYRFVERPSKLQHVVIIEELRSELRVGAIQSYTESEIQYIKDGKIYALCIKNNEIYRRSFSCINGTGYERISITSKSHFQYNEDHKYLYFEDDYGRYPIGSL